MKEARRYSLKIVPWCYPLLRNGKICILFSIFRNHLSPSVVSAIILSKCAQWGWRKMSFSSRHKAILKNSFKR